MDWNQYLPYLHDPAADELKRKPSYPRIPSLNLSYNSMERFLFNLEL